MKIESTQIAAAASEEELRAILQQDEYAQYADTTQIRNANGRIIGGNGFDGADDQLTVTFSTEATFNKLLTYRAGGVPKYSDQDFITITTPGDNKLVVHTPVTEYHIWRFPIEHAHFKKGQGELVTGMPIALWPYLSPSQIRELNNASVRTVEQIAGLSDSNAGAFAGFYSLKAKAKEFLSLAEDKAAQGKLQAELDQRDHAHKNEIAALKEQMEQMFQLMQSQAEAKKSEPVPDAVEASPKATRTK